MCDLNLLKKLLNKIREYLILHEFEFNSLEINKLGKYKKITKMDARTVRRGSKVIINVLTYITNYDNILFEKNKKKLMELWNETDVAKYGFSTYNTLVFQVFTDSSFNKLRHINNMVKVVTKKPLFENCRNGIVNIRDDLACTTGRHIDVWVACKAIKNSKMDKKGESKIYVYVICIKEIIAKNIDGWINTNLFKNHLSKKNIYTIFSGDGAVVDNSKLYMEGVVSICGPDSSSPNHRSYCTLTVGNKWKETTSNLIKIHSQTNAIKTISDSILFLFSST